MKNRIIPLGGKDYKVLGFSDEHIIFSSKGYGSFESLVAAKDKSGMLESVKTITVSSIKEVGFNERDETFNIKYDKGAKTKKETVLLENVSMRSSVVAAIASLKGFNRSVV